MRGRVSTCALSAAMLLSASAGAQSTGSFPPVGGGGAPPPSGSSYPPPGSPPPPSGGPSRSYPPPSPSGSSYPPPGSSPPPSSGSYPSQPGAGAYPSQPPGASRYPAGPPPRPAGQVLGPYQRPRDATMPGYGDTGGPRPVMRVEQHDYRHDGFYLRLGFNVSLALGSLSTDAPISRGERRLPGGYQDTPFSGSMSGLAPGTQIAVGFTPLPGFAVGVGIDTASILHGQASMDNPQTGDYVFRTSQLALFTALADWYFDPEAGFHAQGGLGLATYVAGVGEPKVVGPRADAYTAVGFGFHLGVGWDAFVTRQWSLGVLGRLMYGSMSGSDPKGSDWSDSMVVPGLSLTGTYH